MVYSQTPLCPCQTLQLHKVIIKLLHSYLISNNYLISPSLGYLQIVLILKALHMKGYFWAEGSTLRVLDIYVKLYSYDGVVLREIHSLDTVHKRVIIDFLKLLTQKRQTSQTSQQSISRSLDRHSLLASTQWMQSFKKYFLKLLASPLLFSFVSEHQVLPHTYFKTLFYIHKICLYLYLQKNFYIYIYIY